MRHENGFTLIELIIVIAIIAFAAGVATFNLGRSTKAYVVRTCSEKLIQELRNAKTEALARNKFVAVIIDGFNSNFATRVLMADGVTIDPNIAALKAWSFKDNGVLVALNNINNSQVTFSNVGRITSVTGGNGQISLTKNGTQVIINLSPNTGFVR